MKIGDEVVCIDDMSSQSTLKKGTTYTITDARTHPRTRTLGVKLDKIKSPGITGYFKAIRFRKLDVHPNFKSEISKKLARTPLIKEGLEKVKKKELETV